MSIAVWLSSRHSMSGKADFEQAELDAATTRREDVSRTERDGDANARHDEGAAVVEFALLAPLLIVLVFGIINYGIIISQQLALNHAVREAARSAVVQASGSGIDLTTEVRQNAEIIALDNTQVTVSGSTCSSVGYGNDLVVSADYQAQFVAPMPVPGLTPPNLQADASFRCEWE